MKETKKQVEEGSSEAETGQEAEANSHDLLTIYQNKGRPQRIIQIGMAYWESSKTGGL